MNEGLRWTYLNAEEIRDKLADQDIFISITTVRLLLNLHGFKRRKIAKTATIKEVANRDAQFTNIDSLVAQIPGNRLPDIEYGYQENGMAGFVLQSRKNIYSK